MSIADRVAVMHKGEILQIGTPEQIYLYPTHREVAAFVGQANFLIGEAQGERVRCVLGELSLQKPLYGAVEILVRPEMIELYPDEAGHATILATQFLGHDLLVKVRLHNADSQELDCRTRARTDLRIGLTVRLEIHQPLLAYPKSTD
jgi:iron(III) transport system ATP-binding protein